MTKQNAFLNSLSEEDRLQAMLVKYVRLQYPSAIILHVPNEGKRTKWENARLKYIGVLYGFPDLVLLYKQRTILIELKTAKGKLQDNQTEVHERLTKNGFIVHIIRDFENGKAIIDLLLN